MNVTDSFVEISLANPEDFLVVKETLTRIGIASRKEKKLVQTCHILHKKGRYYIVHFLEMFLLDGKSSTFSEEDAARRNTIIALLEEWNLLKIVDKARFASLEKTDMRRICVVPHRDKDQWTLVSKYNIGSH